LNSCYAVKVFVIRLDIPKNRKTLRLKIPIFTAHILISKIPLYLRQYKICVDFKCFRNDNIITKKYFYSARVSGKYYDIKRVPLKVAVVKGVSFISIDLKCVKYR
jgi:hypothetical protein